MELFFILVLVGTVSGTAAGLFGVGGGIITVPALLFLVNADFRSAVATSLLVITVTTPVGLWSHHRKGKVRWRLGWVLGVGGLAGVAVATLVDPYLEEFWLEVGFAGFLLYSAQRLAVGRTPDPRALGWPAALLLGASAGVVAKLLGIGGGVLVVPALVLLGLDIHLAVATSLVSVLVNALASTGTNLVLRGGGEWVGWALPVALGSLGGIWLGSHLGLRAHHRALQRAFAVALVLVASAVLVRALA